MNHTIPNLFNSVGQSVLLHHFLARLIEFGVQQLKVIKSPQELDTFLKTMNGEEQKSAININDSAKKSRLSRQMDVQNTPVDCFDLIQQFVQMQTRDHDKLLE